MRRVIVTITFLAAFASTLIAQSVFTGSATVDGFTITKVVSDTAINTGQTFSYSIYFTIPAGATNVTVSDILPANLEFLAAAYSAPGTTPTVSAPTVGTLGGTYSLTWATAPAGCAGSISITVRFPNGITCPGTTARNRACLLGTINGKTVEICTPYLSTRAKAVDPWNITKNVTGAAWQGGACPYATADSVVTYQICVYKDVGNTGQLNLVSGVVTDVLPVGAVLQSSTCGATQVGQTITWNVGNMSALPQYNTTCCTFTVLYPRALFPTGSLITNQAILTGSLGSTQQPCGPTADTSQQTCVEIKNIVKGTISKFAYTNRQPGCQGKYVIWVCNNGNTPLTNYTVTDNVPATLTGLSVGNSSPLLNVVLTGNTVTVTTTATLNPGQCVYFEINFTIPANAAVGSTITNCATLTIPNVTPVTACNSFVVDAPAPKACVWKEVCNEQVNYTPGSTFRYRLRVQNIGGQPLTGSTITDQLDPNLQYLGNASYYTSTNWAAPCQTTSNWAGVNLTFNSGTNTVTASLPTIPASCQSVFYPNCGMYGTSGIPFYYIEFDVRVVDTSALGNVPNNFTLAGGTLPTSVTSNTDLVTVVGVSGFTLTKGVRIAGPGVYTNAATTGVGGNVDYKLQLTIPVGNVALRYITFADLLPIDDVTLPDKLIIGPCTSRGSLFDVQYAAFIAASHSYSPYTNATPGFATITNLTPVGAPSGLFTGACGSAGTWGLGMAVGSQNLAFGFSSNAIGSSSPASIEFTAATAASAQVNQIACNSFVASGAVRHLLSSTITQDIPVGMLESNLACVTVKQQGCLGNASLKVDCAGKDQFGNQQYTITINGNYTTTPTAVLTLSSPQGSFNPASFPITSGAFTLTSTFTDLPPVNSIITIYYSVIGPNGVEICKDSVIRDLPPCPGGGTSDDCCKEFIRRVTKKNLVYNNAGNVSLSTTLMAGPAPIKQVTATLVSVQRRRVCGTSINPWERSFGDINSATLSPTLAPGPLTLQIFSREASWGPGECLNFMQGAGMQLNMIFPPVQTGILCRDTLVFAIRYTFTDCKCVTCNVLVYDTLVRKYKLTPWDNPAKTFTGGKLGTKENGEKTQADSAVTMFTMADYDNGKLAIVNPATNNDIKIVGIEMLSPVVTLTGTTSGSVKGTMNGPVAFIPLDCPPGRSVDVSCTFANNAKRMQFPVDVRYLYTDNVVTAPVFSEPVRYIARVPDSKPDVIAGDPTTKPANVKTFALTFTNANGYRENVAGFTVTSTGSATILAAGPSGADAKTATYAIINGGSTYVFSAQASGDLGVATGGVAKPMFLTLANVEAKEVPFDFVAYDAAGEILSKGSFVLSDPISSVRGNDDAPAEGITQSLMPNPAGESITVSLNVATTAQRAELVITDVQGQVVMTLFSSRLDAGNHVIHADVSILAAGSYLVSLRTPTGMVTSPLRIVR